MTIKPGEAARRRLRELWVWITGAGYRPERRYMRGGHGAALRATPAR